MFKDILTPEITAIIITAVVLPFLVNVSRYLVKLLCVKVDELQTRIENDKVNHYIDHAEDAIITAVDAVTQTFVTTLKDKGEFNEAAAKEAFNKAKEQAIILISEDAQEAITDIKGDFDVWVSNKIESYVINNKGI